LIAERYRTNRHALCSRSIGLQIIWAHFEFEWSLIRLSLLSYPIHLHKDPNIGASACPRGCAMRDCAVEMFGKSTNGRHATVAVYSIFADRLAVLLVSGKPLNADHKR